MDKKTAFKLSKKIENFPSFSEILTFRAKHSSSNILLIQGDKKWTYKEFDGLVNQCCRYFIDIGLKKGNTISLVLRNSIDYLIMYFAAIRGRIIVNPFPHHMSGEDVLERLKDIIPEFVFCHESHFESISKSNYKIENLDNVKGNKFLIYLKKYSNKKTQVPLLNENEIAVYYYSSGTTGGPKIIEYTHNSMVATQASMIRAGFTHSNDVHLCFLPLGHTAALRYTIKQCICTGSTVVLYDSFWKLRSNLWNEVQKYEATFMEMVPSILITVLNTTYKNFTKTQTKSLRFIGCGSSFLPKNLQDNFENKFNVLVSNLYGLSETGATHFDDPRVKDRVTGNIGKPFDIVKAKIFDVDGNQASIGEIGEIGIKGSGLLKGYLNQKQMYQSCFHKGYFMTGDLCKMDKEGNYYYVDRKKDIVIKGGVNIVPSQIEELLQSHPIVKEIAVVGIPDMLFGENIKCYVVLKDKNVPDVKELKSFCMKKLGEFKTPSEFEFVENLPKGPSGKILKRELRSDN